MSVMVSSLSLRLVVYHVKIDRKINRKRGDTPRFPIKGLL